MGKRVLLIISGGIAAYKCLELIRELGRRGIASRCLLTRAGAEFVTPLALSALSGDKVYGDLFSLTDEQAMGHIELSRDADLLVVAPATANLLAKMAAGLADDLASTVLLATDKPVMVAPAMNVRMWQHAATRANLAALCQRGITVIGPDEGDMACGEFGMGRMSEPPVIADAIMGRLNGTDGNGTDGNGTDGNGTDGNGAGVNGADAGGLAGRRALVTSGPTHEPIDPVRYIANRSSGKQGSAIARALAARGAETLLITGPTSEPDPAGVTVIHVQTALDMMAACTGALAGGGVDIAVCAAAVADWRLANPFAGKLKKGENPPALELVENPDILAALAAPGPGRPRLVIGFAAETANIVENARAKLAGKGCDWIVANDVSPGTGTFGGADNTVHLVTATATDDWPRLSKQAVAERLAARIQTALAETEPAP